MMSPFESFLKELAEVLGFSQLAPDTQGACLIMMKEGHIPLLFEFDDQLVPYTILVSSLIGLIPPKYQADLYEAALIGNETIEQTLSIKPDEDLLYLHQRLQPAMQAPDLEKVLNSFLDTLKIWKETLENITKTPPHEMKKKSSDPSGIQVFPYKA